MHGERRLRIGGDLRPAKVARLALDVAFEAVAEGEPLQKLHVGFALARIDEDEARQVFDFLEGINQLDDLKTPE